MGKTNIAWTDYTDNPIYIRRSDGTKGGHWCKKISPGCANCYAESVNQSGYYQFASRLPYSGKPPDNLAFDASIVQAWVRKRNPARRFVCSMTDLFGEWIDRSWQFQVFDAAAAAPSQTIQLLTKRPEIALVAMSEWCIDRQQTTLPDNIWMGVTIENAETAKDRIYACKSFQLYVKTPWISYEPALEVVDFKDYFLNGFRWIVLGGESGANARECDVSGLIRVVEQALNWHVAPFVKQLGAKPVYEGKRVIISDRKGADLADFPQELSFRQFPVS